MRNCCKFFFFEIFPIFKENEAVINLYRVAIVRVLEQPKNWALLS
jgi:hypothetical protein